MLHLSRRVEGSPSIASPESLLSYGGAATAPCPALRQTRQSLGHVAGAGFEPASFRVMSPACARVTLPRYGTTTTRGMTSSLSEVTPGIRSG